MHKAPKAEKLSGDDVSVSITVVRIEVGEIEDKKDNPAMQTLAMAI